MQYFECELCGNRLYFESFECTRCKHRVAYLPDLRRVSALKKNGASLWQTSGETRAPYRMCRNATEHAACNWMVPAHDRHPFCRACRLTLLMPDLDAPDALPRWRRIEHAKRRLIYGLDQLGLPLDSRQERPRDGLAFVFLTQGDLGKEAVLTGHANGMVTINVNEADDAYRENMRKEMREAYRTVLGHLRHEIGHYYWDRLVRNTEWLQPVRALFGDERQDYGAACARHYRSGPPDGWQERYVSAYATMHPWEDWAESWSHYLHIADTLDTSHAYALAVGGGRASPSHAATTSFEALIADWLRLAEVLNSLNRSMGLADPYPFVLSASAIEKLGLVHEIVRAKRHPVSNGSDISRIH